VDPGLHDPVECSLGVVREEQDGQYVFEVSDALPHPLVGTVQTVDVGASVRAVRRKISDLEQRHVAGRVGELSDPRSLDGLSNRTHRDLASRWRLGEPAEKAYQDGVLHGITLREQRWPRNLGLPEATLRTAAGARQCKGPQTFSYSHHTV